MDRLNQNKNLIAQLGLEDAPEELRLKVLKQAADLVTKRVVLRLMESLPAADVPEANKLAAEPEELLAFLSSKVPDVEAVIQTETEAVKNEMVAAAALPDGLK